MCSRTSGFSSSMFAILFPARATFFKELHRDRLSRLPVRRLSLSSSCEGV